jgi:hypothetical protein
VSTTEFSDVRASGDIERLTLAEWQSDPWRRRGRRAVLVEGAYADTTAVTTWTPELLADRYPALEVDAKAIPFESWSNHALARSEKMELRRFVELLRGTGTCQIAQHPLAAFDGLLDEIDAERMAEPPYRRVNFWMGDGTRTPLHYDKIENVFVQVYGTKRFVLEPPDSSAGRYLYAAPAAHVSMVDPEAPDLERFPEYDAAGRQTVLVRAGDALYLPPGWFHDVTALDTSISVNFWFGMILDVADEPA